MVECRIPERDLPPPCCVLEQDTLLPESTGARFTKLFMSELIHKT